MPRLETCSVGRSLCPAHSNSPWFSGKKTNQSQVVKLCSTPSHCMILRKSLDPSRPWKTKLLSRNGKVFWTLQARLPSTAKQQRLNHNSIEGFIQSASGKHALYYSPIMFSWQTRRPNYKKSWKTEKQRCFLEVCTHSLYHMLKKNKQKKP